MDDHAGLDLENHKPAVRHQTAIDPEVVKADPRRDPP